MNWKMLALLVILFCLIIFPAGSQSQAQEGEMEVAFGVVVSVASNQIVIMEYDYIEDLEKEEVYLLNAATQYEDVKSGEDIQPGDSVEIAYIIQGGKKVAQMIKKESLDDVEEGLEWEGENADPAPDYDL